MAVGYETISEQRILAAIRPAEGSLTLSTMLFADEIVKPAELETYLPGEVKLTDKELNMARQLINSLVTEFDPTQYQNEYCKSVMGLIDSKAEGAQVGNKPIAAGGKVIDIMAALEARIKAMEQISRRRKK